MLPVPGEIMVQPGQKVEALTVVAQAQMPSRYRVIDVARQLAAPNIDMNEVMLVKPDDKVEVNQIIAARKGGLLFQRSVRAPAAGHIAAVGPGWVLLETEQTEIELQAFINGWVSRVIANWGVIIESSGATIEAAIGFGGEAHGRLKRVVNSPYDELLAIELDENVSEAIVLGGRTLDEETLRTAEHWKVRGIIVGSIDAGLLKLDPPVKVRVVATEGFGDMPMSPYTFGVLTSLSRRDVSIRGVAPHSTANADETSIILAPDSSPKPATEYGQPVDKSKPAEMKVGSRVRVTQGRRLGGSGLINAIPAEPQVTESGLLARGPLVKFNDDISFIPWANLEQIE